MSVLSRVIFDPDTTAPSVPGTLTLTVVGEDRIDLSWGASTDTGGSGLAGYDVLIDGSTVVNLGVQTTYSNTGLSPNSTHNYRVRARDGNANLSAYNTQQQATTNGTSVPGTSITSVTLIPAATGTLPFRFGHVFKKGDVPSGTSVVTSTSGVTLRTIPLRRWNDGSLKHALLVGSSSFTSGSNKTVALATGTTSGGTALTAASIVAAVPTASVQLGSIGTVNLSTLLSSPFRTLHSTPDMVECHYRGTIPGETHLIVWFHVQLFAGGRLWVRAFVENGFVSGSPTDRTYVATAIIGGVTIFSGTITHERWTRWDAVAWIGGDPQITPSHNVQYLIDTKLVPNYWKRNASAGTLSGLNQSYSPTNRGSWPVDTSGTGFGTHIGPLPLQDALYCTTADPSAYRSVVAQTRAFNCYGIFRRSSASNRIPRPSDFPTTTYAGGGGGTDAISNSQTWDVAHSPNSGFLAYLITGEYYFLETAGLDAATLYFCRSTGSGSGTNRSWQGYQVRGVAWCENIVGRFCAIAPTENVDAADLAIVTDFQSWFANNVTSFKNDISTAGQNQLGIVYQQGIGAWDGDGSIAIWMQDFWVAVHGLLSEMDPISDLTDLTTLRDWAYRIPVGRLGATGSANYHFSRAAQYGVRVHPTSTGQSSTGQDETAFLDSWGDVWTLTHGSPNAETTNTLQGTSGSNPGISTGYWANLLPAISLAVDHAASGASAAYARLTGASNYSTFENSGFNNTPIFGIVPRSSTGPTTALAIAAASLQPGQSMLFGTIPASILNIDDAGFSVLQYFSSGVYDSSNKQARLVGRRSSTNYGYRFLIYSETANSWSINTPVWSGGSSVPNGHGYDHNTIDPATGIHYFREYNSSTVRYWTPSTGAWGSLAAMGSPTPEIAGFLEWIPGQGLVYGDRRTTRLHPGASSPSASWTTLTDVGSISQGYHGAAAYNRNSDTLLWGWGNFDNNSKKATSSTLASPTNTAASGFDFGSSELGGLITPDPGGNGFIGWKKETQSWRHYDLTSWSALTVASSASSTPANGVPPLSSSATGRHSAVIECYDLNVIMFIQYVSGSSGANVYLYQHS